MTRKYTCYKNYAVYTQNDELVMVGTAKECSAFMGITNNSFKSRLSNVKCGRIKGNRVKYKVYQIEEREDD